jgi:hypothetical protein
VPKFQAKATLTTTGFKMQKKERPITVYHFIFYTFTVREMGIKGLFICHVCVQKYNCIQYMCAHDRKISHLCCPCVTLLSLQCELIDLYLGHTLRALLV